MKIKRFHAENFRNIEGCDISLSPGVNLFVGMNAQGKTNAIEGIYMFSRGRSHRTSDDREMIRFGTDGFRIGIEYEDSDGIQTLEYACFGRERARKKNGYKISRVAEMIGSFKSVLFYPDNLEIVKDGPDERRAFLNVAISQVFPSYLGYYTRYKEALEARNKLLKLSREQYVSREEIEAWSRSMAEYASYVYVLRVEYLKKLEVYTASCARELSGGKEEITLEYKSDVDISLVRGDELRMDTEIPSDVDRTAVAREYYRILTSQIERECAVGSSLWGPHRDDVIIKIDGVAARSFASQGQKRSIVLALKLAEGEVIRELFGEYPVFLFDDVLSELDDIRRDYIMNKMRDKQVIITTCETDFAESAEGARKITVENGVYTAK
jgi:DNA replication and repair protein RecF